MNSCDIIFLHTLKHTLRSSRLCNKSFIFTLFSVFFRIMPRCDFTMTITQFFVWLTLLNSLVSSMKACNWGDKCCQNIVLSKTYYTVKVTRLAGKAHLHFTCSENSTNDYQKERRCTFNDQYPRMSASDCSTKDMLAFIDHFKDISKQTETLQFNHHTKNTGFIVYQNLFSYFPKLQEISLLHADLKLDGDNIVWPKSLNKLSIYNSTQAFIPNITGNHFTKLIIELASLGSTTQADLLLSSIIK